MKSGLTVAEMITQIRNEAIEKRDYIASTENLRWELDGTVSMKRASGYQSLRTTNLFREQVASKIAIPRNYFERMQQVAPELLATNVNHWFTKEPKNRMIRTLGANARAFLSERYRPLDNMDLATMVLPKTLEAGFEIKSAEITEQRLYIQAVTAKIQGEVKVGDVVQGGLVISNSEVGCGSLSVEPMIYRLVCTNGMIAGKSMTRKHTGKVQAGDAASFELFSDKTRHLTDQAFWAQVNDIVAQTCTQESFNLLLKAMQESTEQKIKEPTKAVEEIKNRYALSDSEQNMVLDNLIKGGDSTKWGLVNAVTRIAEDVESYDRAIQIQRFGGEILELPKYDVIFNN